MNRAERRQAQAKVNRLGLEYKCNGCGTYLVTIGAKFASKKPQAASNILGNAGARHREATGCRGTAEKDPKNSPMVKTSTMPTRTP